jgi:hypothetical protein
MKALRFWFGAAALLLPLLAGAQAPALEVLSPRPGEPASTTREFVNVLGRTTPGSTVRVGGEAVTVFSTGVFARDRVPLQPGANTIEIEARAPGSSQWQRLPLQVERSAPPTPVAWPATALWLDGSSLRPAEPVVLAPGEGVEVAVRATPGARVEARLPGQKGWQPLIERGNGRYRALLAFEAGGDFAAGPVQLRVMAASAAPTSAPAPAGKGKARAKPNRALTTEAPGTVGQWRDDPERLHTVGAEGAELLHGLHEVRLGGPFLAELPAGTLLAATGRRGDFLRVQLAPDTSAWVQEKHLQAADAGTPAPQAVFTSVSLSGEGEHDLLSVPLAARVPYRVTASVGPDGREFLDIEIYNAQLATTWVSHRAST